jgi:hypothetical protein
LKFTDTVICPPAEEYVVADGETVTDWARAEPAAAATMQSEARNLFMRNGTGRFF